jgi:tetratricopeptide (TPR) repeat protein
LLQTNAFALYNTAQGERALPLLEQIPPSERNAQVWVIIANIYEDKGDIDKAIEMLNEAIAVDPKFYKPYYNLGVIYMKSRSYELAKRNFQLAVRRNSKFAHGFYNLGCVQLELKEYAGAKRSFIKALNLEPRERDFYTNLAYAYKMLGRKKAAEKVLESRDKL